MTSIYCLKNPITNEVFYVGATTKSLKERLRVHYQHLKESNRGKRNTSRRYEYLNLLAPYKALIELIEEVELSETSSKERHYIDVFRRLNPLLTNMTDGGVGQHTSKYYTEEEKEQYATKLSNGNKGRPKPLEFSKNLSTNRKGLGNPAAREMLDWLVAFKAGEPVKLLKYGFEINNFVGSKCAHTNVTRRYTKGFPYGYSWVEFKNCTKDVQDIVHLDYENNL